MKQSKQLKMISKNDTYNYIYDINRGHQKTHLKVFDLPTPAGIVWRDIEGLLVALGGEIYEKSGSLIVVHLRGQRAVFHRPHPRKEATRGMIKRIRLWLEEMEIRP